MVGFTSTSCVASWFHKFLMRGDGLPLLCQALDLFAKLNYKTANTKNKFKMTISV